MHWSIRVNRIVLLAILLAAALDFCANYLAAHVLLSVGSFLIPGGSFVFALSFVVYDYLRRQWGVLPAVSAVLFGFLASMLYAVAFGGTIGRIAIAGLVALACSSSVDLLMQTLTLKRPIWQYVGISNAVSLAVDTLVFVSIAFALLPLPVRLHIMEGQYLAKIAMTLVAIPLVYWARSAVPTRPVLTAEVGAGAE